ncbi:bifunctional protein-disulfide isomerase/oxidoreductase DsbC [Pseudidiomarina gelatinasegens]|uniref:bifunctional protein-disulfide isomerase/oxidoreductase DsbC n=1 Tax=Pseudidiomarina gelatinasegens TaxID=2487740 RepID=UPI003A96C8BA
MKYLAIITLSLMTVACSPAEQSISPQPQTTGNFDTSHMQRMGFKVESAKPADIAGLYEVITDQGLVYASDDGQHIISGRIFDITGEQPNNVSEKVLEQMRTNDLATVSDTVIEYTAPNQQHVIHVFTDTSCGYCRQLHERIDEYLDAGITVRYLAWPRNGLQSKAAVDLQNAWCADDQQAALTAAKNDEEVALAMCNDPVAMHFALGQKFGVRGTPAIVLESGRLLPGFVPPERLLPELQK